MLVRHFRQRAEQPVCREYLYLGPSACHSRQIPAAACQHLGNAEQLIGPEFTSCGGASLVDDADGTAPHQIEMCGFLASAEQRFAMEQDFRAAVGHAGTNPPSAAV